MIGGAGDKIIFSSGAPFLTRLIPAVSQRFFFEKYFRYAMAGQ